MARAEETVTSLLQPINGDEETRVHPPGQDLIEKAMAARHWVAIGEEEQTTTSANAGRKIKDSMLSCVAVSIARHRCVALIDSRTSQSYMALETVTLCELECELALLHLELADGTKIKST